MANPGPNLRKKKSLDLPSLDPFLEGIKPDYQRVWTKNILLKAFLQSVRRLPQPELIVSGAPCKAKWYVFQRTSI
jgi:hypothetical protein